MTKIRPFTLGNTFFPDNKEELEKEIKNLMMSIPTDYNAKTRTVIIPHAAYKYSGKIALNALQYMDKNIETVFIFAPAHYLVFFGAALTCYDAWSTPLGDIEIDKSFNQDLNERYDAECNDRAFENEHGIDVQIPLIQTLLPNAKIVPITYGKPNIKKITEITDNYYSNKKLGFVFSSDLSHFYSMSDAQKMDEHTASEIERKCIIAASQNNNASSDNFAIEGRYSVIRVDIGTSGEIGGSDDKVEGYGSWMIVRESIAGFLKAEFSDTILTICRNTIISGLEFSTPIDPDALKLAPVFDTFAATYVSVYINDELRGRAGSAFAFEALKSNLVENAYNAAFKTEKPVYSDEIDKMKLEICILSRPRIVPFSSLNDLADKLVENEGLVIRNETKQAVFLPSKWKEYSDKRNFLNALIQKAEFGDNPSPSSFEAYQFKTVEING